MLLKHPLCESSSSTSSITNQLGSRVRLFAYVSSSTHPTCQPQPGSCSSSSARLGSARLGSARLGSARLRPALSGLPPPTHPGALPGAVCPLTPKAFLGSSNHRQPDPPLSTQLAHNRSLSRSHPSSAFEARYRQFHPYQRQARAIRNVSSETSFNFFSSLTLATGHALPKPLSIRPPASAPSFQSSSSIPAYDR